MAIAANPADPFSTVYGKIGAVSLLTSRPRRSGAPVLLWPANSHSRSVGLFPGLPDTLCTQTVCKAPVEESFAGAPRRCLPRVRHIFHARADHIHTYVWNQNPKARCQCFVQTKAPSFAYEVRGFHRAERRGGGIFPEGLKWSKGRHFEQMGWHDVHLYGSCSSPRSFRTVFRHRLHRRGEICPPSTPGSAQFRIAPATVKVENVSGVSIAVESQQGAITIREVDRTKRESLRADMVETWHLGFQVQGKVSSTLRRAAFRYGYANSRS